MRGRPSWVIGGCLALPRIVPADDRALRTPGFAVSGTPVALPAATHLTAYRIVQEALANTLKHAGRTRVRADLVREHRPARPTIRICDEGPAGPGPSPRESAAVPPGAGHGLVGMRGRIAAVGGALHTGPRHGGGYCAHAVLDLS